MSVALMLKASLRGIVLPDGIFRGQTLSLRDELIGGNGNVCKTFASHTKAEPIVIKRSSVSKVPLAYATKAPKSTAKTQPQVLQASTTKHQ